LINGEMRNAAANFALLTVSLLIAVTLAEVISRVLLPVSPGTRTVTLDGDALHDIMSNLYRHQPNLTFRQVSQEFDARVTIDRFGNRVPEPVGNPAVIFLGDSFTFGHGLSDEETFVAKYCAVTGESCVNMGRSGSGTLVQVRVLENYLEVEGWRPREIKLFLFAMTATLASGNDILDNYYFARVEEAKAGSKDSESAQQAVRRVTAPFHIDVWLKVRRWLIGNVNLVRIAYFRFAPHLRLALATRPSREVLQVGLDATRAAFGRLQALSRTYSFQVSIYVVHPVQDILGGTDTDTTATVRGISGDMQVESTADLYREEPQAYYFPYDGHLNTSGAQRISDFLLSLR